MLGCWPRVVPTRIVLIPAWLLAALSLALPADAAPSQRGLSGIDAWLADTGAHALQVAEPDNDPAAGGREALNRGLEAGLRGLQQSEPVEPYRITAEVGLRDDLQPAYAVVATQPLIRTWEHGDQLRLGERLAHDPDGQTGGGLGLYYSPRVLDEDLTLAFTGTVEDHWRQGYRRFGIGTELRSPDFELGTSLFDDVPGTRNADRDVGDRRLDGYGIALGARVPELPWAWIRARKQWQIPLDSEEVATSDRLSLQLGPFAPLEIETGSTGDGERRSWFAQLRFRIELGGGR